MLRLGVSSPQNSPSLSGDEVYDRRDDIGNRKSSENVSSGCMGRQKDTVLKVRVKIKHEVQGHREQEVVRERLVRLWGREKDTVLKDRVKKNTRCKDIGNRKSSENVSSGCMGRYKEAMLKDRVKIRGAGTKKMSLQTGVVRKCLVRLQGRYKDAILNDRVSCTDEGMSWGTGSRQKILGENYIESRTRQLNRGSSENVPSENSKGCIYVYENTTLSSMKCRME